MASIDTSKYIHSGAFDRTVFISEFTNEFSKNPKYNASLIPDLAQLLDLMEQDSEIRDIRWMAYMLATTMWETTALRSFERQAMSKGKPVVGKDGKPVMLKSRRWVMTMAPVEEVGHGKGRRYHEPVKVKKLPDGTVRITEHDGDQFKVKSNGAIIKLTAGADQGANDGVKAAKAYLNDDGEEHVYYGRGYVQLTWWSNYVRAGLAINKGFDVLLNPDLVKERFVAYKIMAYGMRTGKIFANGHRFSNYFNSAITNYKGARAMVNGHDHASDIAKIAESMEAVLSKSI